ncbi:hypothetical protein AYI69_g7592 [Smittium culicis]|uniref:Reverse transcriptase domain-containing protein n=1 Tax=Smittium culicis TaxID=133412 RepID=A0A1R1XR13_9FUNG|nr:hypothetical protein AYI69_g7592 [Smittium culicis]
MEILHTSERARAHGRGPPADAISPSLQEEDDPGGERGHHKEDNSSLVKESHRGSEGQEPGILQQPVYDSKEDGRPPPSLRSPGAQQPYGGALLQDADLTSVCRMIRRKDYMASLDLEVAFMHVLIHQTCKKYLRFVWNGRTFQFRVLLFGLSLSPHTFTEALKPVLTWARAQGIRGRPFDNRGVQGEVFREYREIPKGPQGQDQISPQGSQQISEDGQDDIEMSGELHWESSSSVSSPHPWMPNVKETSRIEEQFANETKKMDWDGTSDKTRSSEFRDLETETTEME